MQVGTTRKLTFLLGMAAVLGFIGGCKKPVASTPPTHAAPAPSAAQPTVTLSASPTSVNSGGTVTLSWTSTDATDADIEPGVGKVAVQGATPVNPESSTTYTITATGPGGTATATARVTVGAPAPKVPVSGNQSMSELFEQNVKDAYFDFNKADIRPDARDALGQDGGVSALLSASACDHRRTLRRTRFYGIQYWLGRTAGAGGEELSDLAGNHRQPDGHRQLGQGAALLHRAHRRVLATESPRPLRSGAINRRFFDNAGAGLA